ncbi:hypothetical protein [Phycicoccus duodecadis]|uniref:Uncharacterized protein n=1 Tax=Phycicoccus duodecadis TaxID=173053 RepID=A0A2N3YJH2_9MICO|nr:hypothetical protein [Phycicoccus duodecadis]PKW27007.1 hypothetical protein ATL31_1836 [Phycicoccus duodecadis]
MTRRALAVALALVVSLAGLAAAVAGASPATPGASGARSSTAADDRMGAVVLIGTAGLRWSDVDEQRTPNLWLLLRDGSSAALSVRSVYADTCPVDGWLGVSAGGRAAAPRPGSAADPADRACPGPPSVVDGRVAQWPAYLRAARDERFDSRLGLLARQVTDAGLCVRSLGPYAAAGGALPDGRLQQWSELAPEDLLVDLNACPVTLVDVGVVRDPGAQTAGEAPSGSRAQQVRDIDARIGAVIAAGPNGADFVVASLGDAGRSERLRMVVARGPHFGPGMLRSGSTRQLGLAQTSDLTATVLAGVGVAVPDAIQGSPLRSDPAPDNSERRARERLQTLRDLDESSHDVHDLVEPFFQVFSYGQLVVYLLALVVWTRRLGSDEGRIRLLGRVRTFAVVAASIPVSTFLANLTPWWRFPVEMVSVVAAVLVFAAVISTVALRGPWGHRPLGPLAFVSAVTIAVLSVDVMTGSRLQLSSLMGLQPVVGGRFYGMGNPTFGLYGTATVLLATAVSSVLVARGARTAAAVAVGVLGAFAVVVDGAPFWGADGGGPPALVPAVVYLVLAVLGIRLTWKRGALVVAGVVGLFLVVAGLDWLRAPAARSHLGRFVQAMLDGTADDIVVRKAQQNYDLLTADLPLNLLVPLALLVAIVLLARPTSWGSRRLSRWSATAPTLRPGLVALVMMLTIGFLVNDSGVSIPAVGASLAAPLIVSVVVAFVLGEARAVAPTRAGRRARRAR